MLISAAPTISSSLTEISTVVTQALGIITDNAVLMVLFCGGLLGVGFKVIRQAKRTSNK